MARPDHTVQDLFNVAAGPIDPAEAFWIVGRDSGGTIRYLQAMRLMKSDGLTLAEFMARQLNDFLPNPQSVEMSRVRYRPGPNAHSMKGRMVYSGEFWIDGSNPELRGSGLSNLLGRNSYLLAMRAFSADYVFAFMLQRQAERGAFFRAAFHNIEPYAMRWCWRGSDEPVDGSMLYMSRADMEFALDLPVTSAPVRRAA
ncbi:MAG: hypothetical protein AAFY38_07155 [Pseudomonadota bacterium]